MSASQNPTSSEPLAQSHPALVIEQIHPNEREALEQRLTEKKSCLDEVRAINPATLNEENRKDYPKIIKWLEESIKRLSDPNPPRKFVLFRQRVEEVVILVSSRHYYDDEHEKLARRHHIHKDNIIAGGIADLEERRIYGCSYKYGLYDQNMVRQILPDWQIESSGNYE